MSRIFCMRGSLFTNDEFNNLMPVPPPRNNNLNDIKLNPMPTSPSDMRNCNGNRSRDSQQFENPIQLGYMPIPNSTSTTHEDMSMLIEGQVSEMRQSLANIRQNIYHRNAIESRLFGIVRQWRDVAMVMDRFFFLIYMMIIAISLVVLFPRPKWIYLKFIKMCLF